MSRTYGDRADGADKTRLLKKQADTLKKDKARIQKELNRAHQRIAELEGLLAAANEGEPLPKKKQKGEGLQCDDCGKGTMEETLRLQVAGVDKVYVTCNNCGHRKVQK